MKLNHAGAKVSMAVERVPGEKMYIDWVGDKPYLICDPATGEMKQVHIFATTLGVSSMVYAEAFLDEELPSFITGTVNALNFYGESPKYLVPDNCKTAVTKHTKDEIIINSAYQDLEDFYDATVLPPPPRKPKGKSTVENHVRYLETRLIEKLKENTYISLQSLNDAIKRIIVDINQRQYQKMKGEPTLSKSMINHTLNQSQVITTYPVIINTFLKFLITIILNMMATTTQYCIPFMASLQF